MPLLAGKVYILNKRLKKGSVEGEEKKEVAEVLVESTGEVCATAEEANRKRLLYAERIWSCRITGQSGLTLKEALKSEQGAAKVVKIAVKRCHEGVLLAQVHHSRDSLENIIHKAWTLLHEEFCINEPVMIKLTSPKEILLKGVVVKIDRSLHQENDDLDVSPTKVASDASISDKENIKKKTVPIKKSYHYSVKLFDMDKLVNDIPAETIERTLRPPSKEQIRMFIRSHAIRHSNKNIYPWIVDEDIVKKYKLPNLEPEYVNDKSKLKEMSRCAEIQMYNKIMEDAQKKNGDTRVDLTFSEDEIDKKFKKAKRNVDQSTGLKKLKQMTLLELHTTTSTPKQQAKIKSPFTSPSRQIPPLAQQLLRLMKENPNDIMINQLLLKCCQYTELQISRFPEIIRGPIKEKKDKLELKKKLRNMSQTEREAFMVERRLELKQQLREKKKDEVKLDDADMDHKMPLLDGSPIEVIGGMTQDQWARLVSLSEFVRSFKGLLGPASTNESGDLVVDDFCRAVVSDADKDREMLADIICLFLKPLLQDGDLRARKEMGVCLGEIPVTACTAGELLRLILPISACKLEYDDEKEKEFIDEIEGNVNNASINVPLNVMKTSDIYNHYNAIVLPICDKLKRIEIYDLSLEEKIIILELLQNYILELNIISTFIDECHREATDAYKNRLTDVKELNDKLRIVRQSMSEMYKIKNLNVTDEKVVEDKVNVDDDLLPLSTKRRLSIEIKNKEAEEREKRLDIERQYQKLEKEETTFKKLIEQSHQVYNNAFTEAKQLMRVQPLGSDRNNCRYWQFRTTSENLIYIEREVGDVNKAESVFTTWTVLNGVEEVKLFMESLDEKGLRESALKKELSRVMANMPEVKEMINKEVTHVDVAVESFLVRGFKDELRETELNIRQGSLGGVENYIIWDERLTEAYDLSLIKQSFVSVFLGVHERFWNAPLKSVNGRNDYIVAIEDAVTQSRLNLLQYFLDVCICWSKSASDDKCRVCHKKTHENRMLLCDACNRAYHTFCLRPPMKNIPDGEWLCPGCKPVDRVNDTTETYSDKLRQAKGKKILKNSYKYEDEGEPVSEDDEVCCVCETSEEGLGKCVSCGNSYHAQCHEPPLRNMRRNNWSCSNCRVEDIIKSKSKKNKLFRENSSVSESDEEEKKVTFKKNKKNFVTKKKTNVDVLDHDDDEEVEKVNNKKNIKRNSTKKILKEAESDFDDDQDLDKITSKKIRKNVTKKIFKEIESDFDDDQDFEKITNKRNNRRNVTKKIFKEVESDFDDDQDFEKISKKKNNKRSITKNIKETESDEDEIIVKSTRSKSVFGKINGYKRKHESASEEESIHESDQDAEDLRSSLTGIRFSRKRNSLPESSSTIKRRKTVRDSRVEHINKSIKSILKQMVACKSSWPFREPVDEKEVPDYYTIIENPMDLSMMTQRYKLGVYDGEEGLKVFVKEIAQIFTNADFYNDADSAVMKLAVELEQFFFGIYSKCELGVEYIR